MGGGTGESLSLSGLGFRVLYPDHWSRLAPRDTAAISELHLD